MISQNYTPSLPLLGAHISKAFIILQNVMKILENIDLSELSDCFSYVDGLKNLFLKIDGFNETHRTFVLSWAPLGFILDGFR